MFGIYQLVPGDPAKIMLDGVKASVDPKRYQIMYEQAREQLGLDQPIWVQYVRWITNMLRGNFGYSSYYRMQVAELVVEPMKNTLLLNLWVFVLVFAITIPMGIWSAVKKYSGFDHIVQVVTVIGYSLPTFILSLLFLYVFSVKLKLFPISGMRTPGFTGTGFSKAMDTVYHGILPVLVMLVGSLGGITRYIRTAMIDVLEKDYIRTARAKGLCEKTVIYSHAFRNALIPIVTIATNWFVSIFGGSVVIETIFGWNGIGKVLYDSLKQQDFSVVMAMQMFYVVLTLLGNFFMDLAYCFVDPRVKLN